MEESLQMFLFSNKWQYTQVHTRTHTQRLPLSKELFPGHMFYYLMPCMARENNVEKYSATRFRVTQRWPEPL